MTSFTSRAYAGSADLDRLIDFAQNATGACWPRSTYMKAGDVVWMMFTPGFDPATNIRFWSDDDGLVAYAWFEPPLTVDFDIRPGASPDDSLADENPAMGRRAPAESYGNDPEGIRDARREYALNQGPG
jgi:hypothetical protein